MTRKGHSGIGEGVRSVTLSQEVLRKAHLIRHWLVTPGKAVCEALESHSGEKRPLYRRQKSR